MENKYYTPKIEELRVGFECEMRNSSDPVHFDWEKCIFKDDFSNQLSEDYCFDYIAGDLKEGWIRVKHLNQKDIVELGWRITGGQMISGGKTYFEKKGTNRMITLRPNYYKEDGHANVHIYTVNDRGVEFSDFAGKIKNKSELKYIIENNLEL